MPKTQISGAQIQEQSIQTNVFAPESIDGEIIVNGTITNEKISDLEASKVLLTDANGHYVAADLESVLEESAVKVDTVNSNLNTKIDNQVISLSGVISANKSDIESKLVLKGNELQDNIDVANSTIVANKADIEGKLGTQVSTLNSTIAANKLNIENKLADEVATLNTTISNNQVAMQTELDTQVASLEDQISVLNGNVTGNVSQQVADLDVSKAELAGSVNQNFNAKVLTVAGDILPTSNQLQNIGSATNRFKAIYADEAYLSTNTLYIGDTAVLGTDQETINIKADPDQNINVKTVGVGQTFLTSDAGVQVSTNAMNADVKVQAAGVGSNVRMGAAREVALTAPNINMAGDVAVVGNTQVQGLTVSGNLTVKGQLVDVQATTVQVADNILEINKGEIGNGVTAGQAGIRVDRGQAVDYMMVFDEVDDMFKVGMQGQLEIIASQPWVQANMYVHPATHPASMVTEDATRRFMTDSERNKLAGIEANANNYVHPINHAASMITEDASRRFFTDAERTKLNGIATGANLYVHPTSHGASMVDQDSTHRFVTDAQITDWTSKSGAVVPVTTTTNGLMIAADKAKLDGIAAGAQVNQKAFGSIAINGVQIPSTMQSDIFIIEAGTNVAIEADVASKTMTIHNTYEYKLPDTLPASMMVQDATHRFVTDTEKAVWADKYTKGEVDNKLSAYTTGLDWKESVATFADIATTYADAVDGWVVNVKDTDITYRFNGVQWIAISANSIPMATSSLDGKMSAADKAKLDAISADADKVEDSSVNGNIKINGVESIVYTHPTTDGSQHVPATSTTNNAKVLKAGATAGSAAWGVVDASEVSNFYEYAQDAVGLALYNSNTVDFTYDDTNTKITADVKVDNATIEVDATNKNIRLKDSGVVASTYSKVTVDAKGRVTNGANPTTLAGYGITDAVSSTKIVTTATPNKVLELDVNGNLPTGITGNASTATNVAWTGITNKPTTLAGFAITDAAPSSHVGAAGSAHAAVTSTVNGFMVAADKAKLDGIAAGAEVNQNAFSNVKVGASIAASDSETDTLEFVPGTNIDIQLDAANDRVTINNTYSYTHPANHAPSMIVQDASNRFVTDAEKSTWNDKYTKAEVDNKLSAQSTGVDWKESVATFADIATTYPTPADGWTVNVNDTDITYRYTGSAWIAISANSIPLATTSLDGKMSAADKVKLNGVATGAEVNQNAFSIISNGTTAINATAEIDTIQIVAGSNITVAADAANKKLTINNTYSYTHPAAHAPSIITQDASNRFVTDTEKSNWNAKASTAVATTTADGLMDSADKVKLNGIATGANLYVHPATHAPSVIAQDASNRFMTDAERTKLGNCKQAMSGSGNFAGLGSAVTITLPTAMANTTYAVSIQPTAATNGNLGEVWVIKAVGSIAITNTGSFTGSFDWLVLY